MKIEPQTHFSFSFLVFGAAIFLMPVTGQTEEKKKKPQEAQDITIAAINRDLMSSPSAVAGATLLRDEEGREILARLISAHGELVKIQRADDEREFDVPISSFDEYSEDKIRTWIDDDPEAVDFSLALSAEKKLIDTEEFETAGRKLKTSKWCYKVTLANQTRNELNGAQIEYRIITDDNVAFLRTSATPGKGDNQQDGQAVDIPDMEFNDEIQFETPPVEAHTYEYEPTRGEREYTRDSVKGIWIRVFRLGNMIAEYKSNEGALAGVSWDNEEEIEIKITNRFKDSFSTEESE